jgi:hypothetical protein
MKRVGLSNWWEWVTLAFGVGGLVCFQGTLGGVGIGPQFQPMVHVCVCASGFLDGDAWTKTRTKWLRSRTKCHGYNTSLPKRSSLNPAVVVPPRRSHSSISLGPLATSAFTSHPWNTVHRP